MNPWKGLIIIQNIRYAQSFIFAAGRHDLKLMLASQERSADDQQLH